MARSTVALRLRRSARLLSSPRRGLLICRWPFRNSSLEGFAHHAPAGSGWLGHGFIFVARQSGRRLASGAKYAPARLIMLLAFHKPYGVLSNFTSDGSPNRTLAAFHFPKNVYPIGRLDADSEGLLLLTDEPALNQRLLHPKQAHEREYWAQVERIPRAEDLQNLSRGVLIQERKTLPCRVWMLDPQPIIEN